MTATAILTATEKLAKLSTTQLVNTAKELLKNRVPESGDICSMIENVLQKRCDETTFENYMIDIYGF